MISYRHIILLPRAGRAGPQHGLRAAPSLAGHLRGRFVPVVLFALLFSIISMIVVIVIVIIIIIIIIAIIMFIIMFIIIINIDINNIIIIMLVIYEDCVLKTEDDPEDRRSPSPTPHSSPLILVLLPLPLPAHTPSGFHPRRVSHRPSRITAVIHVRVTIYNCFNEPFAVWPACAATASRCMPHAFTHT